ncbi:hypothetical protein UFOVP55_2 [uncultured Caudovirales phage]|uniref:Uncharacterized protein n=1 Tax=uncultured Caudovirales phage TaxID=2100421 RepID=A0A6J5KTB8_9CAUD|nr:hypothetical protein UFOVP55_2 [uncultured Caudovirales phage]
MAFVSADRVLDSSTSTGTGAFTVSGTASVGYRTFSAVMAVSDTCFYCIQNSTLGEWEIGIGTYSATNTITRTTVISSSNANATVTFSAGTKDVFITLIAEKLQPRVLASTANSATPTLNTDLYDMMVITGQSVAITSFTTNLTGTPVNGQKLLIAITGTTAIALTWGAKFEASTTVLPTTTVSTARLDIAFIWNSATSAWRCMASG